MAQRQEDDRRALQGSGNLLLKVRTWLLPRPGQVGEVQDPGRAAAGLIFATGEPEHVCLGAHELRLRRKKLLSTMHLARCVFIYAAAFKPGDQTSG